LRIAAEDGFGVSCKRGHPQAPLVWLVSFSYPLPRGVPLPKFPFIRCLRKTVSAKYSFHRVYG
jgi:hypothetical protein